MNTLVRDLMRTDVVTVRSDLPISELQGVLLRHDIHGVPVVDDGKLVGIVSRSDIVRQLKVEEERIADSAFYLEPFDADVNRSRDQESVLQAAAGRLVKLRVRDMMITDLVTVRPDATLGEVARCMLEHRIHRVLVTVDGELRGVVSTLDFVGLFARSGAS